MSEITKAIKNYINQNRIALSPLFKIISKKIMNLNFKLGKIIKGKNL